MSSVAFYQTQVPNSKYNQKAFERFSQLGIPSRKVEAWKYSPIAKDLDTNLVYYTPKEIEAKLTTDSKIIFQNNQLASLPQRKGLSIQKMILNEATAFSHFKDDALFALAHSASTHFYQIEITHEFESQIPLEIQSSFNTPEGNFATNLWQINLKRDACAHIIETVSGHTNTLNMKTSLIHLAEGAKLEHLVTFHGTGKLLNYQMAHLQISSHYHNFVAPLTSAWVRNSLEILIKGKLAEAHINGLYQLKNNQHFDTSSYIAHLAPESFSFQLYKGILNDEARSIFKGRVYVAPEAQLIQAKQLNKNLLLSKKAHAHSLPQLEIFADDVKCAHGSTTGQVNPDELFYLTARGIKLELAKQMLTKGYSFDVILKLQNPKLKEYLIQEIEHAQ